jgi:hypothetical protein
MWPTIVRLVIDERSQLIDGGAGKRTVLDTDALRDSRDVEVELVCGSDHNQKKITKITVLTKHHGEERKLIATCLDPSDPTPNLLSNM